MPKQPILTIGGADKTGARVNALLAARGLPTRPLFRAAAATGVWRV